MRYNQNREADERRQNLSQQAIERQQEKYKEDIDKIQLIDDFRTACSWQRSGSTCIGKLSDVDKGLPIFTVVLWRKDSWLLLQIAIHDASELRDMEVAEAKRGRWSKCTVAVSSQGICPGRCSGRTISSKSAL